MVDVSWKWDSSFLTAIDSFFRFSFHMLSSLDRTIKSSTNNEHDVGIALGTCVANWCYKHTSNFYFVTTIVLVLRWERYSSRQKKKLFALQFNVLRSFITRYATPNANLTVSIQCFSFISEKTFECWLFEPTKQQSKKKNCACTNAWKFWYINVMEEFWTKPQKHVINIWNQYHNIFTKPDELSTVCGF